MPLSDSLKRVLVIAPHADDEAMGCAGLLAKLAERGCEVHVMYMAVDGFHHYGLDRRTSFKERVVEIEDVAELLGCSYEIAYGDVDMIEKLDTLPKRELVDLFEAKINEHRPELLLLPYREDYDQDHVATFDAAFAAARPIAEVFGKWLVPHVMTYEMVKINWASQPLPRPVAYCDISGHLDVKLEAIKRHATQLRPSPHIRSLESVEALARIRGAEVGVEYAEAFGVLRTAV
ncbi:MAG: PIG-L family deacetylase [Actinomycetota bacterium]|nr:PIG-L family deacetylase [Actinomycetota bacterium]